LGARLLCSAFEREVWEEGVGGIGGQEAVELFGGGAIDGGYDEVVGVGEIL
jgi:hypothetical protein